MQEMIGGIDDKWNWNMYKSFALSSCQIITISIPTTLSCYRPDAIPATLPIVSMHRKHKCMNVSKLD